MNPVHELLPADAWTVPALLEARCRRTPEARFLAWEDRTWTYGQARAEARVFGAWITHALVQHGPSGARVASLLPNRPEALWALLGTLNVGATYLPLNPTHRGAMLVDMLRRSGASVLITDSETSARLPDLDRTSIRAVLLIDESPGGGPAAHHGRVPAPTDTAEVMFTSGTTGRSKAVPLSHDQLCRGAGWIAWSLGLGPDDTFHAWMPLFHVASQVDCVLPAIVSGASLALHPTFSRSRFWDQVEADGATVMLGFANVGELLLSLPERAADFRSTLRSGIIGGMSADLRLRLEHRFGVRLLDIYGMTEADPIALPAPDSDYPPGSCGQASPDFEVAILDEGGAAVAPGEVGEIACRPRVPAALTRGYEDDAEAMVEASRGLWFHTGDQGRMDEDGFVYWLGRTDDVIRHRGENVSPWELEQIVGRHPAVEECCAIGVPAPLGGDDIKVVVVVADGDSLEPAQLRDWCRAEMAAFMVPRYVELVDVLPRSAAGKLQRAAMRAVSPATWDAEARG